MKNIHCWCWPALLLLALGAVACDADAPEQPRPPDAGPVDRSTSESPSTGPDQALPDAPAPDAAAPDAPLPPDARPTAYQTVVALTGKAMAGRKGGTPGGTAAAKYLAQRLAACGLKPWGDTAGSYLQAFKVSPIVHTGKMELTVLPQPGGVAVSVPYRKQWRCGRLSPPAKLEALVAFVGYGVDHAKHDDYKGINVTGKVVVAISGCPPAAAGHPGCGDVAKIATAAKYKAAAVVLISGDDRMVEIWGGSQGHSLYPVPAALIKQGAAGPLLPTGKSAAALRSLLDSKGPQSAQIGHKLRLVMDRKVYKDADAYNVLGVISSADASAKEYVLAGAHYDHLGFDQPPASYYPGALDNASGTSVVLEAACRMAAKGKAPAKRHVVFAFWGAEEDGLLGSAFFVKSGKLAASKIHTAFNLDMVGGKGSAPLSVDLDAKHAATLEAELKALVSGSSLASKFGVISHGSSDHAHFVAAGVRTVYLYGPHPTPLKYHVLDDLPTELSAATLDKLGQLLDQMMWQMASSSALPPAKDGGAPGADASMPPAPGPRQADPRWHDVNWWLP